MSLAEKIVIFNTSLQLDETLLPENIHVLYPYRNEEIRKIALLFYEKFYNDEFKRRLIIGINPGRHGAGYTGIPFTDTHNLQTYCGIHTDHLKSYEPSSIFIYRLIAAFGGAQHFYQHYYFTSLCPLGFIKLSPAGKELNYNYYDDKVFFNQLKPFIVEKLKEQIAWDFDTSKAFCLGTGKNFDCLQQLNAVYNFFEEIVPLEHPRYVMQYKFKEIDNYVNKFVDLLG